MLLRVVVVQTAIIVGVASKCLLIPVAAGMLGAETVL